MNIFDHPDGATPLDPNEIEGLLLTHITTQGELDRWEQENVLEATLWANQNKSRDIFNESFIKRLHKKMFYNVWRWAGQFRYSDKNIGVPWHQISTNLHELCASAKLWLELNDETPPEIAVRFHHRLVLIHPFPNGNGRHARLMTDIILKNVFALPKFTWGNKDLSKKGNIRENYIRALQEADNGHNEALLKFAQS